MIRPSLGELLRYFIRLGTTGFGGPIALVGKMEREFVHERGWVSQQELSDGLAFAQLAPGPLAAQLAIYLGWLCAGVRGATVAGVGFILPSFVMVLVIADLYLRFGGMAWLQGAFYGVGAAVIAIIARSATKLARTTLKRDRLLWTLFALSAIVTAWTESEMIWLFVLCGIVALFARRLTNESGHSAATFAFVLPSGTSITNAIDGSWLMTGLVGVASLAIVGTLFLYFASAGLFVFGSGLAIVPFLHGGVVLQHHWLSEQQFLDAVAVALITPGPVVITVAFIGNLVAGPLGATAAATRAIAGATIVLGRRAIVDWTTIAIAIASLTLLLRTRKMPEPLVIVCSGILGVVVRTAG